MRRGLFRGFKFVAGALLVMAVLAPGAMGASPGDIYADLADGRLDGSYTRAELEAYARDAVVQGYGNPAVPNLPGKNGAGEGQNSAGIASAGTLPFTGAELGIITFVAAALLLGGLLLRSSARTGGRKPSG